MFMKVFLRGVCLSRYSAVSYARGDVYAFSSSKARRWSLCLSSCKRLCRLYISKSRQFISNSREKKKTPSTTLANASQENVRETTQCITQERHEIQKKKSISHSLSLSLFDSNKIKRDHAKLQNKLATSPTDQPAYTATFAAPDGTFPAAAPPM
jgi:hypothetical protein